MEGGIAKRINKRNAYQKLITGRLQQREENCCSKKFGKDGITSPCTITHA